MSERPRAMEFTRRVEGSRFLIQAALADDGMRKLRAEMKAKGWTFDGEVATPPRGQSAAEFIEGLGRLK